jgi:hypothetical protein
MKQVYTLLCLLALASCGDADFGEQYKKTIYLVNSKNLLYTVEYAYGATGNTIVIPVYCASTEPITSDVTVHLQVDQHALDSLNTQRRLENPLYEDKIMLPSFRYELPADPSVVIRAGEQYGTLEVPVDLDGLDADVAHVLAFSIVSNSAGYDVNPALRSIVHEIVMVNDYSGNYSGSSAVAGATPVPVLPVLKALSANQARMAAHDREDALMVLTVAPSGAVTITPWAGAPVEGLPGCTYDPVTRGFLLYYRLDGNIITEKITSFR